MFSLIDRYTQIQERIVAAAKRAKRDPKEVMLVAVSKGRSLQEVLDIAALGQKDFGENRVEEAKEKIQKVGPPLTWHMIGHIQSRKAKEVPPLFQWVHSVDSAALAQKLNNAVTALQTPSPLPILIECNVSGEEAKAGLRADHFDQAEQWAEICAVVGLMVAQPHLRVRGLMTMAPVVETAEAARPVFRQLRILRDKLYQQFPGADWSQLSMGMTDDFEIAVEEGATLVRIGRAIFAP